MTSLRATNPPIPPGRPARPWPGRLTGPSCCQKEARRTWRTPAGPVGKVDEQVVDAGGLEGDAGVLDGIEFGLEAFLGAQQGPFEALDGQPVTFFGGLDEVPH